MSTGQKTEGTLELVEITQPLQNKSIFTATNKLENIAEDEIGPGKEITLHFSLTLAESGMIIDSNFEKSAVTFQFGDGNLLPGFEKSLVGLKAGQNKLISLSSNQAFGERLEENVQVYPRYRFPADLVLEPGLMISFAGSAGNDQAGVVINCHEVNVEVDFNHPLAGKQIEFKVAILKINAITK